MSGSGEVTFASSRTNHSNVPLCKPVDALRMRSLTTLMNHSGYDCWVRSLFGRTAWSRRSPRLRRVLAMQARSSTARGKLYAAMPRTPHGSAP